MIVFINGRQKRVRRPPMIEGLPEDEFIRRNADPISVLQHGYWEALDEIAIRPACRLKNKLESFVGVRVRAP